MALWSGHSISVPGVSGSKPLGGSMTDPAFHSIKVDKMSTTNPWGLMIKNKLSPHSGSVALRHWNSIHKNKPYHITLKAFLGF